MIKADAKRTRCLDRPLWYTEINLIYIIIIDCVSHCNQSSAYVYADAVYVGYQKAFDKVLHKSCLAKLAAYNINLLNWTKLS